MEAMSKMRKLQKHYARLHTGILNPDQEYLTTAMVKPKELKKFIDAANILLTQNNETTICVDQRTAYKIGYI